MCDELGGWDWGVHPIDTCIKQTTNNCVGNHAQCPVVSLTGRNAKNRWYMYTYSWFTLLYSRNWHNIVNRVYSAKRYRRKGRGWGTLREERWRARCCMWSRQAAGSCRAGSRPGRACGNLERRGGSGSAERAHVSIHGRLALLYHRSQHKIVKQLSSN